MSAAARPDSAEILAELRDIHLPDLPGLIPTGVDFWASVALVLVALSWWLLWRIVYSRAAKYLALRELAALRRLASARGGRSLTEEYRHALLCAVGGLLRRYALVHYPRAEVAGLSGEAWLEFLDRTGGDGRFAAGAGRVLADGPFRAHPPSFEAGPLLAAAERWIQRAGRDRTPGLRGWIAPRRGLPTLYR